MRTLHPNEKSELLASDLVARVATLDNMGYPHVTPLWFLFDNEVFHMTSFTNRPHLERIRTNPRVGLVIDTEDDEVFDRERPNRQIRVIGDAVVTEDDDHIWTNRIRAKYLRGPAEMKQPEGRRGRCHILVVPRHIVAVASV
jgi:nitroimidazol reductase NimA-like FMN-containing flavoprotein (pyridoxamine 5'-phosphate oxidase superfamily)